MSASGTADVSGLDFHPQNDGLVVPEGFQVATVADGIGRARHLAVRENGDIYVAMRASSSGKCLAALRDEDGDGSAEVIHFFGDFGECGSVELHDGFLYFSSLNTLYRIKLDPDQLVPGGPVEVVVREFAKNGTWHNYKIMAFDEAGSLYVNVGSPSNVCQEQSDKPGSPGMSPCPHLENHSGVWRFSSSRLGQSQFEDGVLYATGLRNSVALAWNPLSRSIYAISHGRDMLHRLWPEYYSEHESAELPAEEFFRLREHFNGGWPYTYYDQIKAARVIAPEYGGDGREADSSGKYDDPIATFPGHWGPNDLIFYTASQFPSRYYGGAFVAFVGGWNRAPFPQQGYQVAFVPFSEKGDPTGPPEVFVDGFAATPRIASPDDAKFRPTGLAQGPDGSLYISDSVKGRIWRVAYTGAGYTSSLVNDTVAAETTTHVVNPGPDGDLYDTHCASCHMANGSGVTSFQPPLKHSVIVNGNEDVLISVVLRGKSGGGYANIMPPFAHLDDQTLASILTYSRNSFGNSADPVTSHSVARVRRSINENGTQQ
jgi:glucose/arabinose dehydrogenase